MIARFVLLLSLFVLLPMPAHSQGLVWGVLKKQIRDAFPEVQQVSVDSLASLLETDAEPLLLDIREVDEYAVSHLNGAMQVDPDAPVDVLAGVDKDALIVAYCSVGYRSSAFADRLREAGFSNVHNLEGSIFAWANAGYPVVRDTLAIEVVHPYNKRWGLLLKRRYRADIDR
ncbi:MAG: rhodanese-like domain-containing protein [Rhodothermales bacterium]